MTRAAFRRDLLGAGIFTGLAGIAAATIARPEQLDGSAGAGPHAGPDAELIALCGRFDAAERRWLATFTWQDAERKRRPGEDHAIEEEGDGLRAPIEDEKDELLGEILETPCTTLAGARALAATWRLWEGGELEKASVEDGYPSDHLAWHLVRSLTELPA